MALVKLITFQALLVIIVLYNLDIKQMDIKIIFLHGIIDWFLYIENPHGYKE